MINPILQSTCFLVVLAAPATSVADLSPIAPHLRLRWDADPPRDGIQAICGEVSNDGTQAAQHVRLRIEELDSRGRVINRREMELLGELPVGGRSYFCVPEPAGAFEGFRTMNRETREVPEGVARVTAGAKATYVDAIRDWVRRGAESEHAMSAARARAHLPSLTDDMAAAQAMFRLGQFLLKRGDEVQARRWLAEATRRHPDSWCLWRQQAGVNETGLASLPDFWARVDALGERRYYAPVDMKGMP